MRQRTTLTTQQRLERQKAKEKHGAAKNYYQLEKYKALRYNYALIDESHREEVQAAAVEIIAHGKRFKESIVGMGQRLMEVKALLDHGQFIEWTEVEFELSARMAQNMMNVAREYGDKNEIISLLSDTVLYLLAAPSTPESARAEVEQIAVQEGKSPKVARAQRIVKASKSLPPPAPVLTEEELAAEEQAAIIEVEHEREAEEQERLALEQKRHQETPCPTDPVPLVARTLTFAEWLALMPTDLALHEHLAILELGKSSAVRLRQMRNSLYNSVSNAMPTWSLLIVAVEKELKK